MSIIVITGPAKSGKSTIGQAMRDHAIRNQKGVMLIDSQSSGTMADNLSKLLAGENFNTKATVYEQKWKPRPTVVLVGDAGVAFLAEAVKSVPDFVKFFGPVVNVKAEMA